MFQSLIRPAVSSSSRPAVTFLRPSVRFFSFDFTKQPRIRIGSEAPDFTAPTTKGEINFHQFLGNNKWTVLFSHPADFTPVCTTELGAFAKLEPEFAKLNTQLIGLSADSIEHHNQWLADIEEFTSQGAKVNYPIIADSSREVAFKYDMLDQSGFEALKQGGAAPMTIRHVFVIDPAKKIRLFLVYPASTGRNIAEVLRVVEALQLTDKKGVATPVDWTQGEDVIVPPSVSTKDAEAKFGKVKELKPYLRYVKSE